MWNLVNLRFLDVFTGHRRLSSDIGKVRLPSNGRGPTLLSHGSRSHPHRTIRHATGDVSNTSQDEASMSARASSTQEYAQVMCLQRNVTTTRQAHRSFCTSNLKNSKRHFTKGEDLTPRYDLLLLAVAVSVSVWPFSSFLLPPPSPSTHVFPPLAVCHPPHQAVLLTAVVGACVIIFSCVLSSAPASLSLLKEREVDP